MFLFANVIYRDSRESSLYITYHAYISVYSISYYSILILQCMSNTKVIL